MRTSLAVLFALLATAAEGTVPLPRTNVALKTDVKVKSAKEGKRKNEYSEIGYRTSVEKDTTQKVVLSISVRNMSPQLLKDIKISYQLYELEFEYSTGQRLILSRQIGPSNERLVPKARGELKIEQLKRLEEKVVQTDPLESSYRSTQDMTKIISETRTSGSKFGGYIVEYYVGGELVKRDASSRNLLEAYVGSLGGQPGSGTLRMKVGR